jgi:hypothetical protein
MRYLQKFPIRFSPAGLYIYRMMDKQRDKRRTVARETLRVLHEGRYSAGAETVDISRDIAYSGEHSVFIPQEDALRLEAAFAPKAGAGLIELRNETTVSAVLRLGGRAYGSAH